MIPRILHRVWLGPAPMPAHYVEFGVEWRHLHPRWEHRLWTDANRPALRNEREFAASRSWAQKADILRLEILHQEGGVYADCDVLPLRPFDRFLDGAGFVGTLGVDDPKSLPMNTVIGSEPGAAWMADAIQNVSVHWKEIFDYPAWIGHLSDAVRTHSEVDIVPRKLFFPFGAEQIIQGDVFSRGARAHDLGAYMLHMFCGSWDQIHM